MAASFLRRLTVLWLQLGDISGSMNTTPPPRPAISAVIPNRDGAELLRRTLPPLLAELSQAADEVIVVDDASQDDSVAMLRGEFPTVRVLALETNVGFGAACNLGVREARNELVLLINSDMLVTSGAVSQLAAHLEAPDVFAAGPAYWSAMPDAPAPPGVGRVFNQLGAPAGGGIFRREMFLSLGGFDELYYPFYWEDLDLGWAAWRAGLRILYDGRVRFIHLGGATINKLYSATYVARVRARNRCLFGWKNFSSPRLRRRHLLAVLRHIVADLFRRGDLSSLLGLYDALRMRRRALQSRPSVPPKRTDEDILAQQPGGLQVLLRL